MKIGLFLIMALLLAVPALGTVTITCISEGDGVIRIDYEVSDEPAKVRSFALDVSIDANCATIESITDYSAGTGNKYGIFPGTIDLTDVENPVWNTPVAPNDDPGAEGTGLGTSRVILEMASLYDPNLSGPSNGPATLCKLNLAGSGNCSISIAAEPTRGGVVLENGTSVDIVSPGCVLWPPLTCWFWSAQCYGDCHGNDGDVDTDDFLVFKPAFGSEEGDANYDECADLDRDGDIDTDDFLIFKPNFGETGLSGCTYP